MTEIVFSAEEIRRLLSEQYNKGRLMPRSRFNRWKKAALISSSTGVYGYREVAKLKFVGDNLPRFRRLADVKTALIKSLEENEDAFNP